MPEVLRTAMAEGRLLQPKDLGSLPAAEPPPAPELGPEDELSERLGEAWEGRGAAWWERRQGGSVEPRRQLRRAKRRTQLSSTFSLLSSQLDLSGANSPPPTLDRTCLEARPCSPVTSASQESRAQGVLLERRQSLRSYGAELPLQKDTPDCAATTPSQVAGLRATSSQHRTPVFPSPQPQRKRPRMGF